MPRTLLPTTNLLLQRLEEHDRELLAGHCERVTIDRDQVIEPADQPIEAIFFPEGGVVSIVASANGTDRTEVGIFGREGMSGLAVVMGSDRTPHETFVQVGSTTALRIGVGRFRSAMASSATLQALLLRYAQSMHVQSTYNTMSNAHHRLETRLARWLLMCHDRVEGDDLRLTHAFMSMMIAVQRTGVTVCLHELEGEGLIRARRGQVRILDRARLVALAGDAYGQPEAAYRRLVGPFGRDAIATP